MSRPYKRSIEHDAPSHWVGWEHIMRLHQKAVNLDLMTDKREHSLCFTVLFELGCRRIEALTLRPWMFDWDDEMIRIENVPVLKRRRRYTRNVIIKRDDRNPLANVLISHVENAREHDWTYLIPGYGYKFGRELNSSKHMSPVLLYKRIRAIDDDIWPHWLRDQRSWHLSAPIEDGGRAFDSYLLKAWFEWATMEMPAHYAGRRQESDIAAAMGLTRTIPNAEERTQEADIDNPDRRIF